MNLWTSTMAPGEDKGGRNSLEFSSALTEEVDGVEVPVAPGLGLAVDDEGGALAVLLLQLSGREGVHGVAASTMPRSLSLVQFQRRKDRGRRRGKGCGGGRA